MQTLDEIVAVLEGAGVSVERKRAKHDTQFTRHLTFTVRGTQYRIEWWANLAYLHVGLPVGLSVMFHSVSESTTWPGYKRCLRFRWGHSPWDEDNAMILPLELWNEKEEGGGWKPTYADPDNAGLQPNSEED